MSCLTGNSPSTLTGSLRGATLKARQEGGPVESQTFPKVWYRSRPLKMKDASLKAMEDSGTLTVEPGHLHFTGKKGEIDISEIHRVSSERKGRDFVNRWASVEYGDGRLAMFVDARVLGWAGMFGGNKKLYEVIRQASEGSA